MTPVQQRAHDAWWYCCGRNDARIGSYSTALAAYVDPDEFSNYCAEQLAIGSHVPSIQDQFANYIKEQPCPRPS